MPQFLVSIFTCNFQACDSRAETQTVSGDLSETEVPANWTLVQEGFNGRKRYYCPLHEIAVVAAPGASVTVPSVDNTSPLS